MVVIFFFCVKFFYMASGKKSFQTCCKIHMLSEMALFLASIEYTNKCQRVVLCYHGLGWQVMSSSQNSYSAKFWGRWLMARCNLRIGPFSGLPLNHLVENLSPQDKGASPEGRILDISYILHVTIFQNLLELVMCQPVYSPYCWRLHSCLSLLFTVFF